MLSLENAPAVAMLQITRETFISGVLSLEPGRICMISSYSQIERPRPMLVLDVRSGPVFRNWRAI
jgi:hypothetical protein